MNLPLGVIDAAAFPDIVDAVLDDLIMHSPRAALDLQRVCKAWREYLTTRLFKHLSVASIEESGPAIHLLTVRTHPVSGNPSLRLVAGIVGDDAASLVLPSGVVTALRRARILDLSPDVPPSQLEVFGKIASALHVVRLALDSCNRPIDLFASAPVAVVKLQDGAINHGGQPEWPRGRDDRNERERTLVRHVVVHSARPYALGECIHIPSKYALTVFYAPKPPQQDLSARRLLNETVLAALRWRTRDVFVVSQEHPQWPTADNAPTWRDLKDMFDETVAETPGYFWCPGKIHFMLPDEYRAAVGEDKYRLHTMADFRY